MGSRRIDEGGGMGRSTRRNIDLELVISIAVMSETRPEGWGGTGERLRDGERKRKEGGNKERCNGAMECVG
eukprot:74123-Hanusia_phi.AAC.1